LFERCENQNSRSSEGLILSKIFRHFANCRLLYSFVLYHFSVLKWLTVLVRIAIIAIVPEIAFHLPSYLKYILDINTATFGLLFQLNSHVV
jgi:hypothetical protein